MQAATTLSPAPITGQATPAAPPFPRLWPPLFFVGLFWAAGIVVGQLDKPYFHGFLYGMASAAVLTLLFFGWWWTRRKVRLRDRLLGFLLVVGGGVIALPFADRSVGGFGLLFTGLPAALTAWALWMALAKQLSLPLSGAGALAVVWLTWASFTLFRLDGVDADLKGDFRWRWSLSAEDRFRAERAARASEAAAVSTDQPLSAGPGDWVAFRGPEREGVVRGIQIPAGWSETPPRPLWRQRVGPAWSSVIVVGDRLFTQEQRDEKEAVVCYDAATGKQVWVREDAARFWEAVSGAGPRATPSFAAGRLYTLGATGILNCRDAATGRRHWSRDVTGDAEAKIPQWGFSGSPLVIDDKVVVYAGGQAKKDLLAYRVGDGELAWGAPVGQGSYASP